MEKVILYKCENYVRGCTGKGKQTLTRLGLTKSKKKKTLKDVGPETKREPKTEVCKF